MRIFVSEYLASGAWDEEPMPPSLLQEGVAMLQAVLADILWLSDCEAVTTWDRRLGHCPFFCINHPRLTVHSVEHSRQEACVFDELASKADAVLVIAPEFDRLLAMRCQRVANWEAVSLNCTVEAILQCTDKLDLAHRLESAGIPTLPTQPLSDGSEASAEQKGDSFVVKPRDGAGSLDVHLLSKKQDGNTFRQHAFQVPDRQWISQPFVPGIALSIAAFVGTEPEPRLEILPLGEQDLTQDGRFGYRGGCIPKAASLQHLAEERVHQIVQCVPGLSGYVGVDLIAPFANPEELLIVEINPRLTTSYLGYRALAKDNLAAYFLPGRKPRVKPRFRAGCVQFSAAGSVAWSEES